MGILIPLSLGLAVSYLVTTTIYNLWFHPLAKQPGPFWCRISVIPSFYHSCTRNRHIWSWQQFQIYGDKFRAAPNLLLYQTPEAYNSIFSLGANVKKSVFYEVWRRNEEDINLLGCTDVATHARRRKALALAFTDNSVKATIPFMQRHIDEWNDLLPGEKIDKDGRSDPRDLTEWIDFLMFDMFGDICFGRSHETKRPGPNKLRKVPHLIAGYLQFNYLIAKSPLRVLVKWWRPHGLDAILQMIMPQEIKEYFEFTDNLARNRMRTDRERDSNGLPPERTDMFYFLSTARDPDTGKYALSPQNLLAETNLLIIAGSDTSSNILTGLFFFICRNPRVYAKLVKEIRTNFSSAEEIGSSQVELITKCEYLRAVIFEAFRMSPAGPGELERTVLRGGARIAGEFIAEGVTVGVSAWSYCRNENLFGDSYTFRPERWVVSDHPDTLNTQAEVDRLNRSFHPFGKGVGTCLGQKMAMIQLSIIIGRTLWRYDVRQAPGQTLGQGHPDLAWGMRNPNHFMLKDAYISLRKGPIIQLKKREL